MEGVGLEVANFGIAAHYEAEYRCLYPPYRKHAIVAGLAPNQGPGPGQVNAVQPVGTGTRLGGTVERLIAGIVFEPRQGALYGRAVEIADQQAGDIAFPAQVVNYLLYQQLTLTIRIAGVHHFASLFEQLAND